MASDRSAAFARMKIATQGTPEEKMKLFLGELKQSSAIADPVQYSAFNGTLMALKELKGLSADNYAHIFSALVDVVNTLSAPLDGLDAAALDTPEGFRLQTARTNVLEFTLASHPYISPLVYFSLKHNLDNCAALITAGGDPLKVSVTHHAHLDSKVRAAIFSPIRLMLELKAPDSKTVTEDEKKAYAQKFTAHFSSFLEKILPVVSEAHMPGVIMQAYSVLNMALYCLGKEGFEDCFRQLLTSARTTMLERKAENPNAALASLLPFIMHASNERKAALCSTFLEHIDITQPGLFRAAVAIDIEYGKKDFPSLRWVLDKCIESKRPFYPLHDFSTWVVFKTPHGGSYPIGEDPENLATKFLRIIADKVPSSCWVKDGVDAMSVLHESYKPLLPVAQKRAALLTFALGTQRATPVAPPACAGIDDTKATCGTDALPALRPVGDNKNAGGDHAPVAVSAAPLPLVPEVSAPENNECAAQRSFTKSALFEPRLLGVIAPFL